MSHRYACPCCDHEVVSETAPELVHGRAGLWSFIHCRPSGGCSYHGWFPLAGPEPAPVRPQRRARLSPLAARSTPPLARLALSA